MHLLCFQAVILPALCFLKIMGKKATKVQVRPAMQLKYRLQQTLVLSRIFLPWRKFCQYEFHVYLKPSSF